MVRIGEDTGRLEPILDNVADFCDKEVDTVVSQLTAMMELEINCFYSNCSRVCCYLNHSTHVWYVQRHRLMLIENQIKGDVIMRELMNGVWRKEEGYSLIELIITIAILAIIAAIVVPILLGKIDEANKTTDISNAKLVADAVATAVAQDPSLVGIAIPSEAFDGTHAIGDAKPILDSAYAILNYVAPVGKSAEWGTVGSPFFVVMTSEGVITVTTDTPTTIFPTHP